MCTHAGVWYLEIFDFWPNPLVVRWFICSLIHSRSQPVLVEVGARHWCRFRIDLVPIGTIRVDFRNQNRLSQVHSRWYFRNPSPASHVFSHPDTMHLSVRAHASVDWQAVCRAPKLKQPKYHTGSMWQQSGPCVHARFIWKQNREYRWNDLVIAGNRQYKHPQL